MSVSLDRLSAFRTVVDSGSFTLAAKRLNQARAAVSFNIKQLELELGVTLLHRTTRSLALTDAGERFYARCLRILGEMDEAVAEARQEQTGLKGSLRITSTVEYGTVVLAPVLARFSALHHDLDIMFEAGSSNADLLRDRFDVAIRLGRSEQFSNLNYAGVHLGEYEVRAVFAPDRGYGVMTSPDPEFLTRLPHVVHSSMSHVREWTMFDQKGEKHVFIAPRRSRLVTNNASTVKAMVIAGAGLALLPDWFIAAELQDGRLVDAMPGHRLPNQHVYAMHLPAEIVSRKIAAFVAFLKDQVRHERR
ncbi:LysR family transcriptional regulator [Ochrobactrum sp. RH2CCR150]|uniref:LysR family transcriptional regulator n=1 Tax=Ochrobactrum sp. RH2CCR150 TaxID=2587044 RepID=UPI0015FC4348|nr:DNA-binding transcriptional LysR family regulator [Ochrobactrum sp. RH2CCR150]